MVDLEVQRSCSRLRIETSFSWRNLSICLAGSFFARGYGATGRREGVADDGTDNNTRDACYPLTCLRQRLRQGKAGLKRDLTRDRYSNTLACHGLCWRTLKQK